MKSRSLHRFDLSSRLAVLPALIRCRFLEGDYCTVGGVVLCLLNPFLTLAILHGVFSSHFSKTLQSYPLFLLIGIICVNFFVNGTASVMGVLKQNREIILNSVLYRECLILAAFIHAGVKFLMELFLCLAFSAMVGELAWQRIWLFPTFLLSLGAFVLGTGMALSLLFCFVRDASHLWSLIGRLLFFATPVFYSLDGVSPKAAFLIQHLNPVTPFVLVLRGALMKSATLYPSAIIECLGIGMVSLIAGCALFFQYQSLSVENL